MIEEMIEGIPNHLMEVFLGYLRAVLSKELKEADQRRRER